MAALVGIEPGEVLQALNAARRLPIPGSAAGIQVLGILARTQQGRLLMVVVRLDRDGWDHMIIGAREPTADDVALFEEWEGASDE